MSTELSPEEKILIQEEVKTLERVLQSLKEQTSHTSKRLSIESNRARDLTAELVAATRDEDKAMLASDEAVSHALRDKRTDDMKALTQLNENPYFARFVVEEDRDGKPIQLEYKLGFAANPDCRIVDWRKAPISKLYYEYKEGEEYAEEIQGRDREGKIVLRHSVEIKNGELKSISCRFGTFEQTDGKWHRPGAIGGAQGRSLLLKNILPLITPDQFRTITEEVETAILIQGIAGSGKTTVALHRLAWLLHEDNAALDPQKCGVIVLSNVLRSYISQTLPSMGIHDVPVLTFSDWAKVTITKHAPNFLLEDGAVRRLQQPTPLGVVRLKGSMSFLTTFEKVVKEQAHTEREFFAALFETLKRKDEILANDETRLLTDSLFEEAHQYFSLTSKEHTLDHADEALFMRFSEIAYGGVCLPSGEFGKFEHLVVDEVQDVSATQLASLIEAVPEPYQLTLVGDTAQQVSEENTFPGWDQLRRRWSLKEEISKYVKLEVSHRSTYPIMKLADRIQQRNTVKKGRPGRRPIWFHTRAEEECVGYMLRWLQTAIEKYPRAITAVICPTPPVAKYALSLLEPTFGALARIGDNHSFSFEEGIIVTDAKQVKGLEFTNVLLWDVSSKAYPPNRIAQNLLYIGVTRAEENLAIASWGRPSRFLPHIHSKMVRGYDFTIEEDDQGRQHRQHE